MLRSELENFVCRGEYVNGISAFCAPSSIISTSQSSPVCGSAASSEVASPTSSKMLGALWVDYTFPRRRHRSGTGKASAQRRRPPTRARHRPAAEGRHSRSVGNARRRRRRLRSSRCWQSSSRSFGLSEQYPLAPIPGAMAKGTGLQRGRSWCRGGSRERVAQRTAESLCVTPYRQGPSRRITRPCGISHGGSKATS